MHHPFKDIKLEKKGTNISELRRNKVERSKISFEKSKKNISIAIRNKALLFLPQSAEEDMTFLHHYLQSAQA